VHKPRPLWFIVTALVPLACAAPAPSFDTAHAAAMTDSVRAFAASVAEGITTGGPTAWRRYFAETPAFFMASEGQLVFPNSDSAGRAIANLPRFIASIRLQWGDSVRVDPLAPGLALMGASYHETRVDPAGHRLEEMGFFTGVVEHETGGWRFRNAHWSVVTPPSK
jgi:hypothetical protein